jgi:hypothetical protein
MVQIVAGLLGVLRAVAPETGGAAEDGGERRLQVVRDRGQQGRAQPFRLGSEPRLVDVRHQMDPLDGDRHLIHQRVQ